MSVLGAIIPGWKWISGTIAVVVIGLGAWIVIDWLFIGPRDLSDTKRQGLVMAAKDIEAQLLQRLSEIDKHELSLAVLNVKGDTENDEAEHVVKSVLKDNPRFLLPGEGVLDEIKKGAKGFLFGEDTSGPEKILNERGEIEGVLLLSYLYKDGHAVYDTKLEGKLFQRALDAEGHRTTKVEAIPVSANSRIHIESGEVLKDGMNAPPPGTFWRDTGLFLLSIILALGIPFIWLPVTDWVKDSVRLHNNNIGAFVWVAFVVATAMTPYALFFLFTEEGGGTLAWVVGIVMAAFSIFWTFAMHSAWSDRVGA